MLGLRDIRHTVLKSNANQIWLPDDCGCAYVRCILDDYSIILYTVPLYSSLIAKVHLTNEKVTTSIVPLKWFSE